VQSNTNAFQMAAQIAQADPKVLLNFNLDYLARTIAQSAGMDPTAFLTEFKAKELQAAYAARQEQMQDAQMQNETMKAASGAGKPVDPTSVLAQMGAQ
jgi:hypothetical protein